MRSRQNGFTMIEMLVSLSLVAVTMTILVSVFSGGMRVWQRSECGMRQDQAILLTIEKMKKDLRQMKAFDPIPFKGDHKSMEFPVLMNVFEDDDKNKEPGRKRIFFDTESQMLCEDMHLYRGLKRARYKKVCGELLEKVEKVGFKYMKHNTNTGSTGWTSRWTEDYFPVAIEVNIQYEDVCREQKSEKEFTLAIPVGPIR